MISLVWILPLMSGTEEPREALLWLVRGLRAGPFPSPLPGRLQVEHVSCGGPGTMSAGAGRTAVLGTECATGSKGMRLCLECARAVGMPSSSGQGQDGLSVPF